MRALLENKKKRRILCLVILLFLYLVCGLISPLVTTHYDIYSEKIPEPFEGYRIVQLSDFHCKAFGNQEEELISKVAEAQPDIIVLTGDFVDERHNTDNIKYLLDGIVEIAPVYYITGNHEYNKKAPLTELRILLAMYGVTELRHATVTLEKEGTSILLSGLDDYDPIYGLRYKLGYADTEYFNILLSHQSNSFPFESEFNYDLILSGHVHGGIIRLPLVGGLLGNNRELFPKYNYGRYTLQNSTMISSSGLGNTGIPRFYNPREIVCITLHTQE